MDEAGRTVTVTAAAWAKAVEIYAADGYVKLEDNYFDLEPGSRTVRILDGDTKKLAVRSIYQIR